MGLIVFGCLVFAEVFHWGYQAQRAAGPDMVVEVLVFDRRGRGILCGFVNAKIEMSPFDLAGVL